MTTTNGTTARGARAGKPDQVAVEELLARVTALTSRLEQAEQQLAERATPSPAAAGTDEGQDPIYPNVEEWVNTYLLPTFPRPYGAVGMTRWYWCRSWWAHDEAVTRMMALWYAWENARLEMTGMVGWLQLLDHNLPILCGEDGPFRACSAGKGERGVRHELPPIAETETAPADWWNWWT
ncbi:DUF4913 domain-containing protein [Actinoplanes sp. L3-i22]|uniref:DUF4913 domain-containing protein n=1 Tax=Actinoplanes sp. L3-i22 TaxID=2836373 RepID=UPI001C75F810|nr:DUF4913 domain-containing protein [Actinoplanes sp. L3-i22]BCY10986.1 hypothetical protein L3i22_060740 [Actinoplanes sp. L3-i22]